MDLAAHLEYFYNTLGCAFDTDNPFETVGSYPALSYTSKDTSNFLSVDPSAKMTVFEKHRCIIFPHGSSQNTSAASKNSSELLPKKYKWYPNMQIASPVFSQVDMSPCPKTISAFSKKFSVCETAKESESDVDMADSMGDFSAVKYPAEKAKRRMTTFMPESIILQ